MENRKTNRDEQSRESGFVEENGSTASPALSIVLFSKTIRSRRSPHSVRDAAGLSASQDRRNKVRESKARNCNVRTTRGEKLRRKRHD